MTGDGAGRIITFYSYKGGAGRTMALANTAWILASSGRSVLAVDWDLDAPGLGRFLHPFLSESQLRSTPPGVLQLVTQSTQFMLQALNTAEQTCQTELDSELLPAADAWTSDGIALDTCLVHIDWEFPAGGRLSYLPAGTSSQGYLSAFSQFDWKAFLDGPLATRFLEGSSASSSKNSTTSSSTAAPAQRHLRHLHRHPAARLGHLLHPEQPEHRGAAARPSASTESTATGASESCRSPCGRERRGRSAGRRPWQIQYRFDRIVRKHITDRAPEDYWGNVEIPYRPIYSYEETLAPFREQPGDPKSLLAAYERLTEVITDGQVDSMPRIDETLRRKTLDRYTRHRPPHISDVYVSFVAQDRSWANWAKAVLAQAGFKVHLRPRARRRAFGSGTRPSAASSRPRTPWSSSPRPISGRPASAPPGRRSTRRVTGARTSWS